MQPMGNAASANESPEGERPVAADPAAPVVAAVVVAAMVAISRSPSPLFAADPLAGDHAVAFEGLGDATGHL